MFSKLLTGLAIALAFAAPAFAAPVLRTDIVVSAPVVTIGDLFEDAGLLAATALFRAPALGTSGTVDIVAIRAAADKAGLLDYATGALTAVRVARASAVVDEALLTDLITTDLASRGILQPGMRADAMFDAAFTPVNAEATATPATLLTLRYLPANGSFAARFAIAGQTQPIDISGTVDIMVEVPHLIASAAAGTVLSPADMELRFVQLTFAENAGIVGVEDLVGKALRRQSRAGMMLKASDVDDPKVISRNDDVVLYFRQGPMTLTVKGQALGEAAVGETVSVLNLMSKRVINGVALASGAVEVTAFPVQLAGL
ncbi:MAG: FlgA [Devosia sp.]|nr:FlgA [Devosia sp.]